MEEHDFTSGFNQGYLIARHMPELAKQLSNVEHDSPRMDGIKSGIAEYSRDYTKAIPQQEQNKEELPSWLRRDRFDSFDKDIDDIEKDKDDLERE